MAHVSRCIGTHDITQQLEADSHQVEARHKACTSCKLLTHGTELLEDLPYDVGHTPEPHQQYQVRQQDLHLVAVLPFLLAMLEPMVSCPSCLLCWK